MNAETPETGHWVGRGATNPGAPVSPDAEPVSSRVSSQAREELIRLLDESHDTAAGWRPWNFGHGADAILAAGWRPPLPERPAGSPLSTEPGAVTRLTVNIGPRTAEALNRTRETRGVSLTEALRFLVAAGYSAPQPAADALRAEILAVLDEVDAAEASPHHALRRIAAIVEREPAREEPCQCSGCQSVTEDTPKYYGSSEPAPVPCEEPPPDFVADLRDIIHDRTLALLDDEQDALVAAVLDHIRDSGAHPPQPDSETEWGWRARRNPGLIMAPLSEKAARRSANTGADVEAVCREVGPWRVVQS